MKRTAAENLQQARERLDEKTKSKKTLRLLGAGALGATLGIAISYASIGRDMYLPFTESCPTASTDTAHINERVAHVVDEAIEEAVSAAYESPSLYENPADIHIDDIVAEKLNVDRLNPSYMFDSLSAESFEEAMEIASNAAAEHNATIVIGEDVVSPSNIDIKPYIEQEYGAGSALNGLVKTLYDLPQNLLEDTETQLVINIIESTNHEDMAGFTQTTKEDAIHVTASTLEQSHETNWQTGTTSYHEIAHRIDMRTGCLSNDPRYDELEREMTPEMRENRQGVGEIVFSTYGATDPDEDKSTASEHIYRGRKAPGVDNSSILEEKEGLLYNRLWQVSPASAEWFWYQSRYPLTEFLVEEHEAWEKYEAENLVAIDN